MPSQPEPVLLISNEESSHHSGGKSDPSFVTTTKVFTGSFHAELTSIPIHFIFHTVAYGKANFKWRHFHKLA